MARVRRVDVTKNPAVAAFVRRLGPITKPVDLLLEGQVVGRIVPANHENEKASYRDFTPEEQERAWKEIRKIQRKVGKALDEQGITEADLIRAALEDD